MMNDDIDAAADADAPEAFLPPPPPDSFDLSPLQIMANRYAVLTDVARMLISESDVDRLVGAAIEKITNLINFQRLNVALLNNDDRSYTYETRAETRRVAMFESPNVPLAKGIAGRCLRTRRVTYARHLEEVADQLDVIDPDMTGGALMSVLAVPMLGLDGPVAAIVLGAKRVDAYTGPDIKMARQVAELMGLAVQRQRGRQRTAALDEELLRKTRRLEETVASLQQTNLELDSFIYAASHDLRAPLLSMAGMADLAKLALASNDLGELEGYLDRIHRSIRRLDQVVVDILQTSRARRMDRTLEPTNLAALLTEVVDSLGAMDAAHAVDINAHCNSTKKLPVERRRIRQILHNLISNGMKYRDMDREDSFVDARVDVVGDELHIRVANNGIRIPDGLRERIFEMFFRASNQSFGSGLGLYLVHQHAVAMGGTARLVDHPDETVFEVRIPLEGQK